MLVPPYDRISRRVATFLRARSRPADEGIAADELEPPSIRELPNRHRRRVASTGDLRSLKESELLIELEHRVEVQETLDRAVGLLAVSLALARPEREVPFRVGFGPRRGRSERSHRPRLVVGNCPHRARALLSSRLHRETARRRAHAV